MVSLFSERMIIMKKQIILILVLALATALLCSCVTDRGGDSNLSSSDNFTGGDYIFKTGSQLNLVISETLGAPKVNVDGIELDNPEYESKYAAVAETLQQALSSSDASPDILYVGDSTEKAAHEVILGRCDRVVSRQAYVELEKLPVSDGESRFVIYSNGTSVAIAFDDGDYDVAKIAIDFFISNYIEGRTYLTLSVGYKYSESVDMVAYYEEIGDREIAAQWASLESNILKEYKAYYSEDEAKAVELTEDTIAALKKFYGSFNSDALVSWFANLYEPKICVCNALYGSDECQNTPYCGGAGFYFSNSGRDTLGFMPDLESTAQVFGFLKKSGMLDSVNGDVSAAFPDGEVEKIVAWVKSLQDSEDGYFYHPQWSKQETQANNARMGRDLSHAVSILNTFGAKPIYDTPSGVSGEDSTLPTSAIYPSSEALTGRLSSISSVSAASYVISAADTVPSFLTSESAFRSYLKSFDIRTQSYLVANEISSVADQIKARDKELGTTTFTDILISWFEENQNPADGTWHWAATDDPYYANNGVLKVVTTYNKLGREFPNPLKAIDNAINALTCDTPINHVCDLYNTWFTISFICDNLRSYGNSDTASEVVWSLREQAPDAIAATTEKMSACLCEDGSYSYHPGKTQTTSQGLPVAAPTGADEPAKGDVNATVICTYGNITYMFGALGFSGAPSICTEADRIKFKNLIAGFDQVIKNDEIDPYNPDTFDEYSEGTSLSKTYNLLLGSSSATSSLTAIADPRDGAEGNVMQIQSDFASWDTFTFSTKTGIGGDAFVFESDICFESAEYKLSDGSVANVTDGYLMEIHLGSGQNSTKGFYKIMARAEKGSIYLFDYSSSMNGAASSQYTELYTGLSFGEWFHIKVEYFVVDDYTARAKVYVGSTRDDMELVRVSDNFFDYYANKIDNPDAEAAEIGVYTSSMISTTTAYRETILIDNFCAYKSRISYTKEELELSKNVDGPDQDEVIYNFAELEELPEEMEILSSDGTVSINGGYLSLSGGKLSLPANFRTSGANVASFGADILWTNGSSGNNLLSLLFTEGEVKVYNVIGFDFKVKAVDGESYLVIYERQSDGSAGVAIDSVKIAKNVSTNIRIDFYHAQNIALIYVDGSFVTASDAVYANSDPRIINRVTVASSTGSISLNNIVFEKIKFDFATAVEPETPSDVHEFESVEAETERGVAFTNASVENGYAVLTGKNSIISVPIDVRSPVTSAHLVKLTLLSGEELRLAIVDGSGNIIVAVDVTVEETSDGRLVKIYEAGKGGRYDLVIGSKTVDRSKDLTLSLIWHPDEMAANVEICGEAIASTSVCFDASSETLTPAYGALYGTTVGYVNIDDMTAESMYKYRTPVTLDGANAEDASETLTYDYSVASNLPKAVTMTLNAGGSCVRIEQALKKIGDANEEYSKALMIKSNAGANDRFVFNPSNTTAGASRVVFETEMMISSESTASTYLFQLMFTDPASVTGNITYMPTIGIIGNKVVMTDMSSTSKTATDLRYENNFIVLAETDEWFKLRIEYYQGTAETVRIVIKLNDGEDIDIVKRSGTELEVVSTVKAVVSDNYYGVRSETAPNAAPRNDIKQLVFYGQSAPNAVMYMDNTSFYGDGASCINTDINLVKTLK